jgi:Tol biopolymer transport system component
VGCITLGSALLFQNSNNGRATISDTFASASFSTLPSKTSVHQPRMSSENAIVSAALGDSTDSIRYYEQGSGRAFALSLATRRTEVLSETRLPGFLFSYWIPDSQKVISAFQRPASTDYRLFDYTTRQTTDIGSNFKSLAVAPDGRHIAFIQKNSDDSYSIIVSWLDGSQQIQRLNTRTEDSSLVWRNNDELVLTSRRPDRAGYDLSLLPPSGVLTTIISNKENLETAWSPDGAYLLYSYFAPDVGVSLWLRSIRTGEEVSLGIYTSAKKCAWHPIELAITCGIPTRTSLSRDVVADRTATIDDIYTYDFEDTTLRLIYAGVSSSLLGVTEPLISSTGAYFVFTNMFDSRLYTLPLE